MFNYKKKCIKLSPFEFFSSAVHTEAITSCTISPNHKYLLTTSQDTHCRVWTIRGGNGEFVQGNISIPEEKNNFTKVTVLRSIKELLLRKRSLSFLYIL